MEYLVSHINLIKQLQERGMIAQITNLATLEERLMQELPLIIYCGFDPTANSLHLGHLVPLLCLKRFQLAGHKPIALIGGATGLIGDPCFKSSERKLNTRENVYEWVEKISLQIAQFLEFNYQKNSAVIINNYDWFKNMNALTFLRDIGKHFSVNQMIKKETIKQRLKQDEVGISFTEFSYNLLQSYDFAHLNIMYDVELQIGGSDQWGNITSGIDLTRRLYKRQAWGLTVPLITKADGSKFGKTEDSTVWLDPNQTSPYKFYQFWINTADTDVYKFLKFFTFMELKEIDELEKENHRDRLTSPQYILADTVTRMVHGEEGLITAKRITQSLFFGDLQKMTADDFAQLAQSGMPMVHLERNADLQQALVNSKLQPSRKQARKIISSHAIRINGEKQSDPYYTFCDTDRLFDHFTLLCRGKKNYCLIYWK